MTVSTRVRLMLLVSAIVAAVGFAGAQQPAIPANVLTAPLGQTVPVDPLITVGTLPNGLRYYIRENRQPQARAELRLAVNAGSVLEDEDQRGLAHFVEHMSLQRHAALSQDRTSAASCSRSACVSVRTSTRSTSFDETVYQLQIPTEQSRGDRPVAAHPRRLGAQRVVRSGGDRQGAGRHPGGMAARAGSRRADAGRAVSHPAQGLALRGTAADRQAGDHPERQPRPAEAVLHGLVPARPDGGRRGRRFRQGRDRGADQIALRLDPARPRLRSRGRPTPCRINRGRSIR